MSPPGMQSGRRSTARRGHGAGRRKGLGEELARAPFGVQQRLSLTLSAPPASPGRPPPGEGGRAHAAEPPGPPLAQTPHLSTCNAGRGASAAECGLPAVRHVTPSHVGALCCQSDLIGYIIGWASGHCRLLSPISLCFHLLRPEGFNSLYSQMLSRPPPPPPGEHSPRDWAC